MTQLERWELRVGFLLLGAVDDDDQGRTALSPRGLPVRRVASGSLRVAPLRGRATMPIVHGSLPPGGPTAVRLTVMAIRIAVGPAHRVHRTVDRGLPSGGCPAPPTARYEIAGAVPTLVDSQDGAGDKPATGPRSGPATALGTTLQWIGLCPPSPSTDARPTSPARGTPGPSAWRSGAPATAGR